MRELIPDIEALAEAASQEFAAKNVAREAGLGRCRDAIRNSANSIRAVHRGDFETARTLADKAGTLLAEAKQALLDHPDIKHAGFVHDSEKEYAEARMTYAFIAGAKKLPTREELDVGLAAYLNGLAEAVGELRRYLLDILRAGEVERCEECLTVMDEVYGILVTFDYPDAMTGGLRRTTDNVRGILERTRGDLSLAVRQRDLEKRLSEFEGKLGG
ncbi:MAG TPA: haloacid dehalogenase [Dehalococcoidia bacterium]|nr:haloacid dehalogenase [Dehalococcoidia bacterium]